MNNEKTPARASKREPTGKPQPERLNFTQLLLSNPNYFGNLTESPFPPVKKILIDTSYEEVTCVGFNPAKNLLEATIAIKLPLGYGSDLCHAGTTEYVRFFVDYGSGWIDAGVAAVNVHDLPNHLDCAKNPDKPITYVVTQTIEPKRDFCVHPVLPKVRAILSWNLIPPPDPNWSPIWGNVLDRYIQINPRPWFIADLVDFLGVSIGQKLQVPPPLEQVQLKPIPLPDPPPLALGELVQLYSGQVTGQRKKASAQTVVEPHRFGLTNLQSTLAEGAFSQPALAAKIAEWKSAGLDFSAAIGALQQTSGNVTYEELDCLGLDYNREWLIATFQVKKPSGFSGSLCQQGSKEYVAFWADWEDRCTWTFLGTAVVNVHDIATIPPDGLSYAAILPVDLTYHRRHCDKPTVGRVRAVLSWETPPSETNPDAVPYWGNLLDAHVQFRPGDPVNQGDVKPILWRVGGIRTENISGVTGLTVAAAAFENGFSPELDSPFADRVVIKGPPFPGFLYRVQVRDLTSGGGWMTLATTLTIEPLFGPAFNKAPATPDGFFTYETLFNNPDMVLARWDTSGDDRWEVKLEILGQPGSVTQVLQLKNSGIEDARINIDPAFGGNCGRFNVGDILTGAFVARDPYLSSYGLGTLPFAAPPLALSPTGGTIQTPTAPPLPAPPPGGTPWSLNTSAMTPCGYVLELSVVDKAIRNSVPFDHHWATPTVGFCLLEK